jgi:peptidoglycan/LPS O-acetylase OafA/YrhL
MEKQARIPELDLLRFVAALSVVFYHRARNDVTMFGFLGVHLFFMISGFVILWTAIDKSGRQFVASRISRLFPSFWVCLCLTSLVVVWGGNEIPRPQFLANLTMRPLFHQPAVDPVYWTLNLELKFYGLIFLALVTGQMRNIERWLGVWLLLSAIALTSFAPALLRNISLDNYAPLFVAGCVLYLIRTRGLSAGRIVALGLSLVLTAIAAMRAQAGFTLHTADWISMTVAGVIIIEFVVFYLVATRVIALRASPMWYLLGAMTYPLYLIHNRAGNVLQDKLPANFGSVEKAAIMITLSLLVAGVLAATVERHVCPALNRVLTGRSIRRREASIARAQQLVE